jgi:hypothetical protein
MIESQILEHTFSKRDPFSIFTPVRVWQWLSTLHCLFEISNTFIRLVIIEMSDCCFNSDICEELCEPPNTIIFSGVNRKAFIESFFKVFNRWIDLALGDHVFLDLHKFLKGPVQVLVIYGFRVIQTWWRFKTVCI